MEKEEGRLVVMGRAEIDTRPPFKSVKEAITMFGERVLAGEIYANKLKEMRDVSAKSGNYQTKMGALITELEETKESLKRSREEAELMSNCIKSLQEELEQTKRELQWLKAKETFKEQPSIDDPDLKFIKNATETNYSDDDDDDATFGKRRYVKFASPPSLTKVIVTKEEMLGRNPSAKKSIKRKSLVPTLGWIFSKKKGYQDGESPK